MIVPKSTRPLSNAERRINHFIKAQFENEFLRQNFPAGLERRHSPSASPVSIPNDSPVMGAENSR